MKIVPHLWYDQEAFEAAQLYTSLFADSVIHGRTSIEDTPSGTAGMVTVSLSGQEFMLLSAGPYFTFTPAVSFRIDCSTKKEVVLLWDRLSAGGTVLMPLDSYPFSDKYGWISDKFGLSWQVMYVGEQPVMQKISPALMFTGAQCGRAEEAIRFYASVFPGSEAGGILRYKADEDPNKEGTIKQAAVKLDGLSFAVMDSAYPHAFTFNEAVSFVVYCDTQEEIDYYWAKLSFVPEAEQCGWLKDKFGVSWQIVPSVMKDFMAEGDPGKMKRVTEAFLKMKKFDIAELQRTAEER